MAMMTSVLTQPTEKLVIQLFRAILHMLGFQLKDAFPNGGLLSARKLPEGSGHMPAPFFLVYAAATPFMSQYFSPPHRRPEPDSELGLSLLNRGAFAERLLRHQKCCSKTISLPLRIHLIRFVCGLPSIFYVRT